MFFFNQTAHFMISIRSIKLTNQNCLLGINVLTSDKCIFHIQWCKTSPFSCIIRYLQIMIVKVLCTSFCINCNTGWKREVMYHHESIDRVHYVPFHSLLNDNIMINYYFANIFLSFISPLTMTLAWRPYRCCI